MDTSLKKLEEIYELELDKAVAQIKKSKAKTVVIQLPDGMKPYSTEIVDYLQSKTKADIRIWLGTCFGACDTPRTDADLVIQFGHSKWKN